MKPHLNLFGERSFSGLIKIGVVPTIIVTEVLSMGLNDPGREEHEVTDQDTLLVEPPMYRVFLMNDDYTPMDFVIEILMKVFNKSIESATQIMMSVHNNGSGVCGVYTYEIAETKTGTVHRMSEESGYPLRSTMEKE
jgi:ATP-dependent Clp protease adaptor protein ClpS